MRSKVSETAGFLWGVARNKPIEYVDVETGDLSHIEQMGRLDRWHTFRPYWTFTFLATKAPCGCRKRLGIWPTIWCWEHAQGELS